MTKKRKQDLINKVRTRIAPSPTGYPHVGTAFQALFDWVYARRYDGEFLLRIEDTDQKRLVEDAEEVLYQAFDWLDIEPDESPRKGGPVAPYRQSDRLDIYKKYAHQLVEKGHAYHCFCSQERLDQVRNKQKQAGQPPMYDQHCRDLSQDEVQQRLANDEESVIRMKVPNNQTITVYDKLRGEVKFDSQIVDDQVLLKSDGFPTYHLAVVVDDHLMGISHLVRGEEWLPSAPKHVLLYQYFGWNMPQLIHTPTLRSSDKSKLSKRKGNTSVWWYREHGFLPQALNNFLALLVWKPNEQTEVFTKEEMLDFFEWEDMNVTGPIFDVKKLKWLNGKYLRRMEPIDLKKDLIDWAAWVETEGQDQALVNQVSSLKKWNSEDPDKFNRALQLGKERAKTLADIPEAISFYFAKKLEYDRSDLLQGHEPEEMIGVLTEVDKRLKAIDDYNSDAWEKTIRQTADDYGFSHKDVFMALRSAETARKYTPPLFAVMDALGRIESSQRIRQAINFLKQ